MWGKPVPYHCLNPRPVALQNIVVPVEIPFDGPAEDELAPTNLATSWRNRMTWRVAVPSQPTTRQGRAKRRQKGRHTSLRSVSCLGTKTSDAPICGRHPEEQLRCVCLICLHGLKCLAKNKRSDLKCFCFHNDAIP